MLDFDGSEIDVSVNSSGVSLGVFTHLNILFPILNSTGRKS